METVFDVLKSYAENLAENAITATAFDVDEDETSEEE